VDIQPSIALFLFCAVSKLSKDQVSSTVGSVAQALLTAAQISSTHGYPLRIPYRKNLKRQNLRQKSQKTRVKTKQKYKKKYRCSRTESCFNKEGRWQFFFELKKIRAKVIKNDKLLYPASPTAAEGPAASVSVTAGRASADSPTTRTSMPAAKPYFDTSLSRADFTLWQRPTVSAWMDIQTAVCRAFVMLEWLADDKVKTRLKKQSKGPTSAWYKGLVRELVGLVLVGHVMDPHLNMKKVFR